jgi:hypothetical protein
MFKPKHTLLLGLAVCLAVSICIFIICSYFSLLPAKFPDVIPDTRSFENNGMNMGFGNLPLVRRILFCRHFNCSKSLSVTSLHTGQVEAQEFTDFKVSSLGVILR